MKVVPLVWVTNDSKPSQGTSAAQARSRFRRRAKRGTLAGGGYWNDYDIEKDEAVVRGIWRCFKERVSIGNYKWKL